MGCAASKDLYDNSAPSELGQQSSTANPSGKKGFSGQRAASGYKSSIRNSKQALVGGFVQGHRHTRVEMLYDVSDGTVLGRGACGSVTAVRNIETGDWYALKTVSTETMGGSLAELHVRRARAALACRAHVTAHGTAR